MASSRAPGDQLQSGPSSSGQSLHISPQTVDKGREKKRVGFASDREARRGSFAPSPQVTPGESHQAAADYFAVSPNGIGDATSSLRSEGLAKRESSNKDELTAALAQIIRPEHHGGPVPPKQTTAGAPETERSRAELGRSDISTAPIRGRGQESSRPARRRRRSVARARVPEGLLGSLCFRDCHPFRRQIPA